MRTRVLAACIYLAPFIFHFPIELPLYLSLDCPACYVELQKIRQTKDLTRLYLVDQPLEINCLLGAIHKQDPAKQLDFLEFIQKKPSHIRLQDFCENTQIDKAQLVACKNCHLFKIPMKEILFYAMSYFITTVPYNTNNSTQKERSCTP